MKIRVKIPEALIREPYCDTFVDEILLWGMETEMDVEFYSYWYPADHTWNDRRKWAVFIIENDKSFMFSLKWGALFHKGRKENETNN